MRYLHTMLRVRDLDAALDFYCNKLGMKETRRRVDEKNRYTLVFLAGPADEKLVETSKNSGPPRPGVGTHLQLGYRRLRRGAPFRPSRLRGRRHLRHLRATDEGWRHDQPASPRRRHGFRALAGQPIDRAFAERRTPARPGAMEVDAEYRQVVGSLAAGGEGLYTPSHPRAAAVKGGGAWRPSSRGLGHRPFTAVTGVRIPRARQ